MPDLIGHLLSEGVYSENTGRTDSPKMRSASVQPAALEKKSSARAWPGLAEKREEDQ